MISVTNNRLILKNTLMLYIRQIFVLFVGLYTSRIVLKVLGVVDFGIFNVVAGVVTMLGFLSNALTTACQRYFSFDIGKQDKNHLKNVYATSFFIYLILAIIITFICETIGLWFVKYKLVIPVERITASKIILHISLLTFIITIMTTPFMAIITAHEDMSIYAWISIFECGGKLILVLVLSKNTCFDSMILYSIILAFISFCNFIIYGIICRKKYDECRIRFFCDFFLMKEMFRYVIWNMLSGISGALYNQGLNIVLNLFCGPVINSARAIASQVNGAVIQFAGRFSSAVQPQLIKNYAIKDYSSLYVQLWRGIKLTYALMFIFTLPLCLEMKPVLKLWLGEVPDYTEIFTVLVLVSTCIEVTSYCLDTLAQATGKIRLYQAVVSSIIVMNVPLSILALYFGLKPFIVAVIYIILIIISICLRLLILGKLVDNFKIYQFLMRVLLPLFLFTVVTVPLPLLLHCFIKNQIERFFLVCVFSSILTILFAFIFLLDKREKQKIRLIINQKFHPQGEVVK